MNAPVITHYFSNTNIDYHRKAEKEFPVVIFGLNYIPVIYFLNEKRNL